MRIIEQLARKVRLMVGLGIVKLVDDARQIQRLQVTLMKDEVRERANRYQDYGFTSVPLEGAECLTAAVGGNRSHTVIVRCDDGRHRKKDLQAGEVAIYTDEGDYVLLKRGREIEVVGGARVTVTAPEVICTAETRVVLDTPSCQLTGDLQVDGNVTVDGNATMQGTVQGGSVVTEAGIDLDEHVHSGVQSGGSTTGPAQ